MVKKKEKKQSELVDYGKPNPQFITAHKISECTLPVTEKCTVQNREAASKTVHNAVTENFGMYTKPLRERVHSKKKQYTLGGNPTTKEPELTRAEWAIVKLMVAGITTPHRLAVARKCKTRIIFRHLESLKKKGVINQFNEIVHFFDRACLPAHVSSGQPSAEGSTGKEKIHIQSELPEQLDSAPRHQYRMHAHVFDIRILERHQEFYRKMIGTTSYIDGNTVQYFSDTVVVRGSQSFIADDPFKCLVKSIEYFDRIFVKIEHDARIVIVKERSTAIQLRYYKLGEMENEIAKDCERRGDQIHIYAREDGKLWFMTDDSWLFNEVHCLHPGTAKDDFAKVMKQINDWRDRDPPKLSDVWEVLAQLTLHEKTTREDVEGIIRVKKNELEKQDTKKEEPRTELSPDDYYHIYG